jgi:hypothetical protein
MGRLMAIAVWFVLVFIGSSIILVSFFIHISWIALIFIYMHLRLNLDLLMLSLSRI